MLFINQILHTVSFFFPQTLSECRKISILQAALELSLTISVEKCHHKFATEPGWHLRWLPRQNILPWESYLSGYFKSGRKHFPLVVVNTHSLTCNLACSPAASFANPAFQNLQELLLACPCSKTESQRYPSMQGKSMCRGPKGRSLTKRVICAHGWALVG